MEITGEELGMARIGLGLERDELAERLGISLRTVANWEKNGVPQHRVVLVMSKIGPNITAAKDALERDAWYRTPAGQEQAEQDHRAHEESVRSGAAAVYLNGNDSKSMNEYFALRDLLAPYSTAGLLREVSRRVGAANIDAILAGGAPVSSAADPDYSLSDLDGKDVFDLAANKGDQNIEHDASPHEP